MIALDTNVLVHAHRAEAPLHANARDLVRSLAEGRSPWAIPWPCVHEFLAVTTNGRIFATPTSQAAARAQVDAWMESPALIELGESSAHWQRLDSILDESSVTGARIHDARIAAICLDHGATLCTLDRDFSRFPALKTTSLLAAS